MKRFLFIITFIVFGMITSTTMAQQFQCLFTWNPVTTFIDGTPIVLTGYRLYHRTLTTEYTRGTPTYEIPLSQFSDPLHPNILNICELGQFWVVSAYIDEEGGFRESAFSNQAQPIQAFSRPLGLKVQTRSLVE